MTRHLLTDNISLAAVEILMVNAAFNFQTHNVLIKKISPSVLAILELTNLVKLDS